METYACWQIGALAGIKEAILLFTTFWQWRKHADAAFFCVCASRCAQFPLARVIKHCIWQISVLRHCQKIVNRSIAGKGCPTQELSSGSLRKILKSICVFISSLNSWLWSRLLLFRRRRATRSVRQHHRRHMFQTTLLPSGGLLGTRLWCGNVLQ